MSEDVADSINAVLVHIDFRNPLYHEELDEFIQLAESTGLRAAATITGSRDIPDARYFVGSGKVEEIRQVVAALKAGLVIFNHTLSPAQERNLEREFQCRVLDRVRLILDIFAQRARSYEGKLQVELAQLQHMSTRLIRGWSHLERQKGGIGLRGPGETQLETDRRLIGKRIKTINGRLEKVKQQRHQGRRLRKRTGTPVVSLVGYTNAGKSTLFNHLTGASVYVADKLFATLDPTLRKVELEAGTTVIMSDTVGFIRHIPHDLIEAFHATLEEVKEADLLLHVIDVNDDQRYAHKDQVNKVIDEIEAGDIPQILVFNKIDQQGDIIPHVEHDNGGPPRIWISAQSGAGLDELKKLVCRHIKPSQRVHTLHVPAHAGKLRAKLFRNGVVYDEQTDEQGGWVMEIKLDDTLLAQLCRDYDLDMAMIQ